MHDLKNIKNLINQKLITQKETETIIITKFHIQLILNQNLYKLAQTTLPNNSVELSSNQKLLDLLENLFYNEIPVLEINQYNFTGTEFQSIDTQLQWKISDQLIRNKLR